MRDNTIARGIKKLLESRVLWAALSLCAALAMWVYYTSNYGISETKTFYGVEVAFTGRDAMRDTLNLVVSDQDNSSVSVTLTGTRRELSKLTSDDIKAVVNLSNITMAGYRSMTYSLSYPTTVNQDNIREKSRFPSTIGLQISKLSTISKEFKGSFEGTTVDGYMVDAAEMTFDPAAVTFTGPEEELAKIDTVRVNVDRDDVSAAFTAVGNYVLLDAEGNILELEDVQADVESVSVNVPVSTVKQVALAVDLVPGGGATSNNVIVEITPPVITVAGDAATLDGLNVISLDTIQLASYSSFEPATYNITLPNGVECLSGETTANVNMSFTGLMSDTFIVTNLSAVNAPEGYDYKIIDLNKVVTVRAPADVFPQIRANNIRIVADLSTAAVGRSRVPTTVYIDGFESAGVVGNYPVYVQLEERQ